MPQINIDKISENDTKAVYTVTISEEKSSTTHRVEVDTAYYKKLTKGSIDLDDLIIRSFKFLLQREPKEMILGSFNLSAIAKYFPEYEKVIMSV
jgi:hypothetical protein